MKICLLITSTHYTLFYLLKTITENNKEDIAPWKKINVIFLGASYLPNGGTKGLLESGLPTNIQEGKTPKRKNSLL